MLQAWLNGTFVPMTEATVSAFDAGFQHGVGLFETMAARHGRIFRGLEHMERMRASAKELGLADTLRPEALSAQDILPLRALGMSAEQILDVLHACAIFGWANRLMHNLGEPEAEPVVAGA